MYVSIIEINTLIEIVVWIRWVFLHLLRLAWIHVEKNRLMKISGMVENGSLKLAANSGGSFVAGGRFRIAAR